MRFNFQYPSCDYNIILSEKEIDALKQGEVIHCSPWRNSDVEASVNYFTGNTFHRTDRKRLGNYIQIWNKGLWQAKDENDDTLPIQFLNIVPEKADQ